MAINVIIQYNDRSLPDILLLTQAPIFVWFKGTIILMFSVLPDNAYLSLGKRLFIRGPTLSVIAVDPSEVGPAVLLFVEEICQVLRFQTNSVPRYQ